MGKIDATIHTGKLIDMVANANDDYEYISEMIDHFNRLYPIVKLDLVVTHDTDKIKEYIEIEY